MKKNKIEWIIFVALRYFKAGKRDRSISTAFFSAVGISVGVLAMITIISIMNGFQIGFIDDILEINSYHIRIRSGEMEVDNTLIENIKSIENVKSILPFIDLQTLVKGSYSDFKACKIRSVPVNTETQDPDLLRYLNVTRGEFNLKKVNTIVIGSELAASLGADVGDTVSLASMAGDSFRSLAPVDIQFTVEGIFKSGYYEYDSTMGFTSFQSSKGLTSGKETLTYGIKLKDRYKDAETIRDISSIIGAGNCPVSWREYNRSFFGALRMEKISMMLIVGLIFLVVGVNIKHSLDRSVYKRRQDIALLRSVGASPGAVKTIFVTEGLLIGFSGGLIGVISGLFISVNINNIFAFAGWAADALSRLIGRILSPFVNIPSYGFSVFSPSYFYLNKVPVKILFHEVLLIFFFAFTASVCAAYSAAGKVTEFTPSEILHYE